MMNYNNATSLRQEVLKFLYFLQTLAPVQLVALWQFVQFEDKEQKWSPAQLSPIVEKMTPQQLEQLMILTSANKRLDRDTNVETRQHIQQLGQQLSTPVQLLDCFGSLFQMFQLQDLLHSFSYIQLMKFFEVIPSGSHLQQLQLIQQLQQVFGQLTPEALETLHHEVKTATPQMEMHLLSHTLHLQPEQFHLYRPIRSLLHMEQSELRTFQDAIPKLQPIQMLQLLQLLQLPAFEVIELKKVFYQNQSASSIVEYVHTSYPPHIRFFIVTDSTTIHSTTSTQSYELLYIIAINTMCTYMIIVSSPLVLLHLTPLIKFVVIYVHLVHPITSTFSINVQFVYILLTYIQPPIRI